MLLQILEFRQQFVKGNHLHVLAGVAENLKTTQFMLFNRPTPSKHNAFDYVRPGGAQGRVIENMRLPPRTQLALLMQHLGDSATQLRMWAENMRCSVRRGMHQGCIRGFDFHNGKCLPLLLEQEVPNVRA